MDNKLKKRSTIRESYDLNLSNDWDLMPSCSTLQLFQTNKRLKEAQTDLIVKRIGVPRERLYFFHDRSEIQTNKRELRRQFRKINKTVCDNKASKNKVILKSKEILKAQTLIKDEIEKTKLEIEKYSETKEKMKKYIAMYSGLFISYLESVVDKCPDFNSLQHILSEYEILENCKNECSQLLNKEMDESLKLRNEMIKLVEEKSSHLKNLDNSLVMLGIRRRRASEVRKYWNNVVMNLEQVIAEKLEESVTLQEGCYHLYQVICNKRRMKPIIAKEDTKNLMKCIRKTILFYKDVISLATALQQYQKKEVPVCKTSFVRSALHDLVKKATESTKSK